MIEKIKSILKAGVNPRTAMAAIASIDPRLRGFITAAAAAGYGADSVMEFLQDQTTSEQEKARRRNIKERTVSGRATPQEMQEAQRLKEMQAPGRAIRNVAGLAAGTAASLMGQGEEAPMEEVEGEEIVVEGESIPPPGQPVSKAGGEYIKRALNGVEYFDLPEDVREKIAPYANALFRKEQDGSPWNTPDVQRLVKAIRSRAGTVAQETARVNPQSRQPQQSTADQMVAQAMNNISSSLDAAFRNFMGGQ